MKRPLMISALVLLLGATLTSCKKDYTCTCTEPTGTTNQVVQINNSTKGDAETDCDDLNAAYALIGGSCKLD
jgi:hypothetical protein